MRFIKSERLGKLVLMGENHPRAAVREYLIHSHEERNHRTLRRLRPQMSVFLT
ncbi:MAG TPA: hypothetical protein VNM90_00150 [Haliangium sp.]|nr:hypothetical protein [Haliangium sp.]